ncbi:hypothetical protein [Streptomyces sp. NPDC055299]
MSTATIKCCCTSACYSRGTAAQAPPTENSPAPAVARRTATELPHRHRTAAAAQLASLDRDLAEEFGTPAELVGGSGGCADRRERRRRRRRPTGAPEAAVDTKEPPA